MFNHQSAKDPKLLIIGDYLFNPQAGSISGPSGVHFVNSRLVNLLRILADQSGRVVSREELIERLWPENHGDAKSLNRAIGRLRHYLEGGSSSGQYVEVIPNRGYRLVAPVYGSTRRPQAIDLPTAPTAAPETVPANRFAALIGEFRDRKVCRSMLIYTLVVWLVFQVSEIIVPAVGLPEWVNGLVVVLGILGFPIAAVLSWIFDITPAGLERDKEYSGKGHVLVGRNRLDLVFDSALVVTALTICGTLVATTLG